MAKSRVFVDLETSGLDCTNGAVILSIGVVAELRGKKNLGKVVEFSATICPTESEFAKADPEALRVNGFTWEILQEKGISLEDAKDLFLRWLMEHKISAQFYQYVGQNPSFDIAFLRHFMGGELDFVNFPFEDVLDIRDLYSILVNRGEVKFLKYRSLKNITDALGVEPEPAVHLALEGARAAKRAYDKMAAILGVA